MRREKYVCHEVELRMEFEEEERQETTRESGKGTAMIASRFRSLCVGISSLLLLSLVFCFREKRVQVLTFFLQCYCLALVKC